MHLAARRGDGLFFQIDADLAGALALLDFSGKAVDDLLVDENRQDAILEAIGEEDVAEARADDRAHAALLQRPHGAFTRGAAAEVRSGDEDLGLAIGFAV